MGTINSAFSIITGALSADQSALSIVSNNVANANTPGYTEEVPTWVENSPVRIGNLQVGEGVLQTGARSIRDGVLTARIDQLQQLASASSTRLSSLQNVQGLFPPDSGASSATAGDIGNDISAFFSSFSSLEANATNDSLRQNVLSSAKTLAGDISNASASLTSQSLSLGQEAGGVVTQINSLTTAIAQLTHQIQSDSPNSDAGILEDQRSQDISQLSQLVGINQIKTENNGLSITTTSGQLLTAEGTSFQITNGMVNGQEHFFIGAQDITAALAPGGGQLGGYLTARDVDIAGAQTSLDQLAYGISTSVNNLNNTGVDLDGATGTVASPLYIFSQPTQVAGSAAAMSVIMADPSQIAAASSGQGTGDNSNAVAMAALANQTVVGGQTPINYYSNFVTTLGALVSGVKAQNTAQTAAASQLQSQDNALSEVNLNDEAANLSRMQTSYQAASQVFNILNTIMTSALNLGQSTAVS